MNLNAQVVREGAVTLCLALILGLLSVSGYVVAPALFAKAATPAEAGRLAGEIFHLVNLGVIFMAIAVAAFWMRMKDSGRAEWILLIFLLLLIAGNEFAISPIISDIKSLAGDIHLLAKDDPQRKEFGMWHGVSALAHLLATIAALLLVLLNSYRQPYSD